MIEVKKKYYKDNPEAVKRRDASRVFINGKEISKKDPIHKMFKGGRYKTIGDAVFETSGLGSVKEGYVYIITNAAWPDWVKIGMAVDAEDRLNSYQTSSPMRDYKLEYSVKSDDRRKAEKEAHKGAMKKCDVSHGEWFKMSVSEAVELLDNLNG